MTTPVFEEGSLESEIVKGLFQYVNSKMAEASFDVYRIFGILVKGEMNLNYRVEDVRFLAEFIRTHDYKFETLEYLPSAYDIEPR